MSDNGRNHADASASEEQQDKRNSAKEHEQPDDSTHAKNRSRRNRQRNSQNRQNRFKGQCADLEFITYDTTVNLTNQDLYTTTTRKIGEYVATTFERAGEFRLGMVNLTLPTIDLPANPTSKATTAEIEMYKIDLREAKGRLRRREENSQRIFPLILGQCSRTIRDRMEAHQDWHQVNADSDVMGLLKLIRQSMHGKATTKQATHSYAEAESDFIRFKQTERMTNSDYLEKFKGLIAVYEHCGGEPGITKARTKAFLDTSETDTDKAERDARTKARDEYIAVTFLLKSDTKRYGQLLRDLQNDYTRGLGGYPTTLSEAYDILINYKRAPQREHEFDSDIAFALTENHDQRQPGRGRGGRGGGGRGRGRGPGTRTKNRKHEDADINDTEAQDKATKDDNAQYSAIATSTKCLLTKGGRSLPTSWLLLDSCSTVNMISDRSLLTDIHTADEPIPVHCNAGTITLTQKGTLGHFPDPVWYNPNGIANILSLHAVKRHYHVTMDTETGDSIHVHHRDGTTTTFHPSKNGIYHCRIPENGHILSTIATVEQRKEGLSKTDIRRAAKARRLQNIMMHPNTKQLGDSIIHYLRNCDVTRDDILLAEHLYGPNLFSMKGKTVRRPVQIGKHRIAPVPSEILESHRSIDLSADIMFVNKVAFLITLSHGLRFGTVSALPNRQIGTIVTRIKQTIRLYHHRGFRVRSLFADSEFEPIRPSFPFLETAGADDHIPTIERYIRTIKDRARSAWHSMPFHYTPKLLIIHLVQNAVFWLNAFPAPNGISSQHSPRYIMTGRSIDSKLHARLQFGEYVQMHEEHSNDMNARTTGGICMGPTGSSNGSHKFMSLASGKSVTRTRWSAMPMPSEVIKRVNFIGKTQGMPRTLTFADRVGREIPDTIHDTTHWPESDDESYADSDCSAESGEESDGSDDDDWYGGDDDEQQNKNSDSEEQWDENSDIDTFEENDDAPHQADTNDPEPEHQHQSPEHSHQSSEHHHHSFTPGPQDDSTGPHEDSDDDDYPSDIDDAPPSQATDEDTETTGVDAPQEPNHDGTTGVDPPPNAYDEDSDDDGYSSSDDETTESERFGEAEALGRAAAAGEPLPRRTRVPNKDNIYDYLHNMFGVADPHAVLTLLNDDAINLLTAQMSAKAGLRQFGEAGAAAITKELEQLVYRKVLEAKKADSLTREQRRAALRYLMFLKMKRSGKIKGRGCADGRKQRIYKSKEETSSPTMSTEALFLTCIVDALECRDVATLDIPGAFMQADMDELVHLRIEGEIARLLIRVDEKYKSMVTYEGGKPVIYAELKKALYGTLQAALLFWQELSSFLGELGFTANPYDACVMNKDINGKQCTIGWHVDDLKLSHVDSRVIDDLIRQLQQRFGQEAPLTVTRGRVHDYLGMRIDFSTPRKVVFSMEAYIEQVLAECPQALGHGPAATPAAAHLFEVDVTAKKLTDEAKERFHHIVAQLLYLSKRGRPDLQTAISFLCTRVQQPDIDDYKKLNRCLAYLRKTKDMTLTLEADGESTIKWWVDASFGVHPDLRSHTGATMTLGHGCPISLSLKQKLNTRSSTEAELIGVNDAMSVILWTRMFLEAQGFEITDNVVFQDNQSTMKLENNGKRSSGKKTRHINIRYYFITDNIRRKQLRVEYCPTESMHADFFTKPLQGSLFRRHVTAIMNLPPDYFGGHGQSGITDPSGSQECVGRVNNESCPGGSANTDITPVSPSTVPAQFRGNLLTS